MIELNFCFQYELPNKVKFKRTFARSFNWGRHGFDSERIDM